MKMSVDKIAALAYLKLSDEEKQIFEKQFERILKYVDQLQEVPMTADEAKAMGAFHAQTAFYKELGLHTDETLRDEDKFEEVNSLNLSNEEATNNSPRSGGLPGEILYEVPTIIER